MKKRIVTGLWVLLSAFLALADTKATFLPYVTASGAQSVKTDFVPNLTDTIEVDFESTAETQFAVFVARQTSGSMDLCLFNILYAGDPKSWRLDLKDTGDRSDDYGRCAVNERMTVRYEAGLFSLKTAAGGCAYSHRSDGKGRCSRGCFR